MTDVATPRAASGADRVDARVAIVQRQARITLMLAALFVVGAAVSAVLPRATGLWLPLHLLLVGGVLLAISAATQLFAVTWSAGRPVSDGVATTQRICIALGALLVGGGREESWPVAVVVVGGSAVIAGLVLLAGSLAYTARSARQDRFRPAQRAYLAALVAGVGGSALGIVLASGLVHGVAAGRVRSAHAVVNLLGLVGLVIAGTLPFFVATQARTKIGPRATARHQLVLLVALGAAVAVTAGGLLAGSRSVAALGFAAYAAGLVDLVTVLPRVGAKQWRWAGARLAMLYGAVAWWVGGVTASAVLAARGDDPLPERLLGVLAVGALVQIIAGSLAYLGPVLRGGGHERLSAGFATTRSWLVFAALNVAACAIALDVGVIATAALAVALLDAGWRAASLLGAPHRETA